MSAPQQLRAVRRTKLVCTIGPATSDRVADLLVAGMDVARINFAHGSHASHAGIARAVRSAAGMAASPVGILTDLAGPKIRLGDLGGDPVQLRAGERFVLRGEAGGPAGDAAGVGVTYRRMAKDVRVGDPILLADGAVELRVTRLSHEVETEVVRGGTIRSRAGVSIPAARLSAPALTRKDRADIMRAVELEASYVGQSFVRSAADVAELRALLGRDGPGIVAKIETRPAVEAFDSILEVADAVMIARGDLGVEMPYEQVPLIQKQLVQRALDRGIPSIVATQMLESMTAAPRPTRAEASDVANAVFDGADAIMLSAETAIGAYPIEAAAAAVRIAAVCEADGSRYLPEATSPPADEQGHAVVAAAVALARAQPSVRAIACYTRSGRTAGLLSAFRPRVPVMAFSPSADVVSRLALVNGVIGRHVEAIAPVDRTETLLRLLGESNVFADGSEVVLVSAQASGSAPNEVEVHRLGTAPRARVRTAGASAPTGASAPRG
jgi:pyruvate kinase